MGPTKEEVDGGTYYGGFLNVQEAEELRDCLELAIERAKTKSGLPHPNRVTDPLPI
jgi:hypothetical protein